MFGSNKYKNAKRKTYKNSKKTYSRYASKYSRIHKANKKV